MSSNVIRKLSDTERKRLDELEEIVEQGLRKIVEEVGPALMEIRDRGLYFIHCTTFEEYCRTRLHFSASYAYRLIKKAKEPLAIEDHTTPSDDGSSENSVHKKGATRVMYKNSEPDEVEVDDPSEVEEEEEEDEDTSDVVEEIHECPTLEELIEDLSKDQKERLLNDLWENSSKELRFSYFRDLYESNWVQRRMRDEL